MAGATQPTAAPYLEGDPSVPIPWIAALAEFERPSTCWLITTTRDHRPHVVPVLAVVADGAIHVAADPGTRKTHNLTWDRRATISVHGRDLDVVVEGETRRVTLHEDLIAVAEAYADTFGWQVEARDGALHGDGAPTAGPGPFHVHRLAPERAFGFPAEGDVTPTRWTFP